ncbi:MAG: T9SS type A sorting domain-containing protein [Paludibacter sp.]
MKKIITLLFSALLAVSAFATAWDGTAAAAFAGGTGTVGDPYQIATAEQLAYLASQANATQTANVNTSGIYYKLTADIDLNGPTKSWTPIGTSTTTAFAGIFDGDNHLVSNIYINNTASGNPKGLFGYVEGTVSANVIIKNITMASGSVTTTYATGTTYTAALAGRCVYTQLSNCKNTINVSGYTNAGGIVGRIDGVSTIDGCSNVGIVKSTQNTSPNTGGIVGIFTGLITNGGSDVSYIRSCYNRGAISSPNYVGGIAGSATGNIAIDKCFNTGTINGSTNGASGGIVGYGYNTGTPSPVAVLNISNCYNTGAIKATTTVDIKNCAGGILGFVGGTVGRSFGTILNCYNIGTVTGNIKEPIAAQLTGTGGTTPTGTVTNTYFLASSGTNTIANDGTSVADAATLQTYASTLNNSQSPTVWESDLTPNRNGGYPILSWVTNFTKLAAPTIQTPTAITTTGFTANWTTVENAIGYYVNVYNNVSPITYKTSLYVAGQATSSASITGLTANTSYLVTVLSVAPSGTTYIDSEESGYAVAGISGATVLLSTYSQASATSATVDCTVTDGAGTGVTARGICYATSTANPTTSNTKVIDPGTGNGSYSVNMGSLSANTTYYFRAYATNNLRTNYSIVLSFKILSTPTVSDATGLNATGFTANWTAVASASSYDVNVYQGASLIKTVNASGQATASLAITDLTSETAYTYTVVAKGNGTSTFNSAESVASNSVTTSTATALNEVNVSNTISVIGKTIIANETGNMQIFNLQGAQILQYQAVSKAITNLNSGIYIVRFTNTKGKQTIQKVSIL